MKTIDLTADTVTELLGRWHIGERKDGHPDRCGIQMGKGRRMRQFGN